MTDRMRSTTVLLFSLFIALGAGSLPLAAQGNDFLVTFQPGTSQAARAAAARQQGVTVRHNYTIIDTIAVTIPNQNALDRLAQDPSVVRVTPDFPVFAHQAPQALDHANGNAKPGTGGGGTPPPPPPQVLPAGVQRVLMSSAIPASDAGAGIGVAILDTGIDANHADLKRSNGSTVVVSQFNAIDGSSNCLDDNDHGTHVAGIIAAQPNSIDVVGVAPGVNLFCVKVLNAQGSGAWSTVIGGLNWVFNYNASLTNTSPTNPARIRVVNMSLGGGGDNSESDLKTAIRNLHDSGVVVVVSAGNDSNLNVNQQVPAAYTGLVLTIASSTAANGAANKCSVTIPRDTASYFTSSGAGVTISAPGAQQEDTRPGCFVSSVGILSLKRGGGTTRMSGTSMSSPHVVGIVARVLTSPSTYGVGSPAGLLHDRHRRRSSRDRTLQVADEDFRRRL
jgi:subtilisin